MSNVGLLVKRVTIEGFRSYKSFVIEPDPHLTVFVGPNAVGKTNLIEALQILTAAESFRKPQWSEVVNWGEPEARLKLNAAGDGRSLEIVLNITCAGKRIYQINGKPKRKLSEMIGVLPSVTFTPDDLRLIKDSADKRRGALDGLGVQLSPSYLNIKNEFERVLKQRNAALRAEPVSLDELSVWSERLIATGARLFSARVRLFEQVAAHLQEAHAMITGGSAVRSLYQPSWERDGLSGGCGRQQLEVDAAEILSGMLTKKRDEERARKTTLVGPHRDDIRFFLDEDRDVRVYSSQGQQRTVALAWKLAEVAVIKDILQRAPILLLDDVMSELDEKRRSAMAQFTGQAAQTFVTTTNTGYFDESLLSRACLVRLG